MAVTIRHIKRVPDGGSPPGGSVTVLGDSLAPSALGLSGEKGFQEGMFESRTYEEGAFSLTFPNVAGSDDVQHLDRFGLTKPDTLYFPGNEWIEIYSNGDLLYVGTPVQPGNVTRARVQFGGYDAFWSLRKVREYLAGYWRHAPRDVWEHYSRVWKIQLAEDFAGGVPSGGRMTTSGTVAAHADRPGSVRLTGVSSIRGVESFQIGLAASDPYMGWQVRAQYNRNRFGSETVAPYGGNARVRVGVRTTGGTDLLYIQLQEKYTYISGPNDVPGSSGPFLIDTQSQNNRPGSVEIIVEGRERWVYFFVNQTLVGCLPMPEAASTVVPFVSLDPQSSPVTPTVDLENITTRQCLPYLMRDTGTGMKGDRHLPGAPTPGGLHARYYNDNDIRLRGANVYPGLVFSPMRDLDDLLDERLDKIIDFSSPLAASPRWWPDGPAKGLYWSVRWTGSIYLNLADGDQTVGITTLNEGARVWIGKTRRGEEYINTWFVGLGGTDLGGGLRSHIGVSADGSHKNGWYPIVIEYGQRGTVGANMKLHWSDGTAVPSSKLSPFGIFHEQIRADSHYEAIRTLSQTFGYQMTVEPRTLESGSFPGVLRPRLRVGHDTDLVLTDPDVEGMAANINADGVAQALLGDGAGLADESGGQLTLEALNYALAEDTLFLLSEYEQFGDIGYPPLLQQRLSSLLALRSSPWAEYTAVPPAFRELRDTFPLTGSMSMLNWLAGDGVRLDFPKLGVTDASPRQMLGTQRPFYPVGLGAAAITFKQSPRSLKEFFRLMQRSAISKQRNYQGQVVAQTGTAGAGPTEETEDFTKISRVGLPKNLSDVRSAHVTLYEKPDDDAPWYIWVNGAYTGLPAVTEPGIYDISAYVERIQDEATGDTAPHMEVEFRLVDE